MAIYFIPLLAKRFQKVTYVENMSGGLPNKVTQRTQVNSIDIMLPKIHKVLAETGHRVKYMTDVENWKGKGGGTLIESEPDPDKIFDKKTRKWRKRKKGEYDATTEKDSKT